MLDRMPVKLGGFISKEVYDGKLQSVHSKQDASCIKFVDVHKGQEEESGKSFKVLFIDLLVGV